MGYRTHGFPVQLLPPPGGRGTQLYYTPPSLLRHLSSSRPIPTCTGLLGCPSTPCADRGRAVVRRSPPQGTQWMFWYLTAVILPVQWRILSRFYPSPQLTPRLTRQLPPAKLAPAPLPPIYPRLRRWMTTVRSSGCPLRASHLGDARTSHRLPPGTATEHRRSIRRRARFSRAWRFTRPPKVRPGFPRWRGGRGNAVARLSRSRGPLGGRRRPIPGTAGPPCSGISIGVRCALQLVPYRGPGCSEPTSRNRDMGHRLPQGGRNGWRGQLPITVEAYVGTDYPDAVRFEAIPRRRGIRTRSPRDRIQQENGPATWRTHWLHASHRSVNATDSDLLYVPCIGEDQYHRRLMSRFGQYGGEMDPAPRVQLVAFPPPFGRWYNAAHRIR